MILLFRTLSLLFLFTAVSSCSTIMGAKQEEQSVHGSEPLIESADVIAEGKKDMDMMVKDGPKPKTSTEKEIKSREKRKTITTEHVRNYVSVPSKYKNLKQKVSLNLNNIDFKYAMSLMAEIGKINILVGDEVSGTINAKIKNVPWDIAFQTMLDMKTLGADMDVANGIIRVHTPEKLTSQETFKSARAEVLKKKIELEESVEPILAEIFRLYYISPEQAKETIENLFATQAAEGSAASDITITVEDTTRSIIARAHKTDLDLIDAVLKEIDVKTKQVLIDTFIVEADSTFQRELGTAIGAMKQGTRTVITGNVGGSATTPSGITFDAAAGSVTDFGITDATSGIGILKTMGSAALKMHIQALETLGKTRILSSPSIFTLNNQEAKITQGTQIAYQTESDGTVTTEFKEAALSLRVTPSIIGDGNVLLDIVVNNDSPITVAGSDEPGIKTNEINTKLLVSDGDIVVIGGIKTTTLINSDRKVPGLGDTPIVGNLFKGQAKEDKLEEMLIFLAPRVID